MLLIYATESSWTEGERKECMIESMGIREELEQQGKLLAASPLLSVTTATSVRVRDGKKPITDGPFAGGSLCKPKIAIGQYGFTPLISDTEGNLVGFHSKQ